MPYKDPVKRAEMSKKYCKRWYLRNRKRRLKTVAANRKRIRMWFVGFKQSLRGCSKCGESDYRCLEFHHLKPKEKYDEVSILVHKSLSIKRILDEIGKCVVLCANCHRKLTIGNTP